MVSENKPTRPTSLYRYRPLGSDLVKRELDAIFSSYLYAPRFDQMNDPMEAMIEYPAEDRFAFLMPKELLELSKKALCSGLMKPDTHLGENARQNEVSDDQTTPYLFP
ncbi:MULTISPECIES: hypothetical protein [unclassified Pseudomonas]|uniref:hypothetical protein n=1 Tax=unclassified Pseudomonas TaxID=196821 RepID=UPI0030D8E194